VHHLALVVLFYSITNFLKSFFSFVKEALALGYLSKSLTFLLLVVTEANDFPSCCWLVYYFIVGRGVSEQLQLKFLSRKSLRIMSGFQAAY
jgi:hypothetical protein